MAGLLALDRMDKRGGRLAGRAAVAPIVPPAGNSGGEGSAPITLQQRYARHGEWGRGWYFMWWEAFPCSGVCVRAFIGCVSSCDELIRMPRWHQSLLRRRIVRALMGSSEVCSRDAEDLLQGVVAPAEVFDGSRRQGSVGGRV